MDPRLTRLYQDELAYLRELGREFAREHPKIAARLGMEGLEVADPYVERLLEGFAFLAARIHLKLDDDVSQVAESLLAIVAPQLVRPVPSLTIAEFVADPERASMPDASSSRGSAYPR